MLRYTPNDEYPPIVLDNGSGMIRAGFAGDDAPLATFPNIVGTHRYNKDLNKIYIGDDAQDKRELLSLSYPMQHGIITDWDSMEKVWNHLFFSELKASPEQHPILISEPPLNPRANREKMANVMFEKYNTPAFYVGFEPVLILFSVGHLIGTMTSIGDGVTHVVPVIDGYAFHEAIKRRDFGGRDLTRHLQHLLLKRAMSFTTTSELDLVREMKEQLCFVATTAKENAEHLQFPSSIEKSFKLPDGSTIKVGHERSSCPEVLFQPDSVFLSGEGISQIVADCISACDIHCHKELNRYIPLAGGTTLIPGFQERLQKEIEERSRFPSKTVRVVKSPERQYHVWIGGSVLASLSTFQQMWITKEEYYEHGPSIVHRKCV